MNSEQYYYEKYLKYKIKYLELKGGSKFGVVASVLGPGKKIQAIKAALKLSTEVAKFKKNIPTSKKAALAAVTSAVVGKATTATTATTSSAEDSESVANVQAGILLSFSCFQSFSFLA